MPESLSKWASESLAATAKASHCHVGAVWCLVLAELRELDKQGVRVKRGKRASVRASKGSQKTGKEEMAPDLEGLDISLTNILDEITEEDGNLDWAWPDFDRDAFGSCQTVLTPTLELDIYCTVEDDTIEAVADACDAEVSDVLTFSTYFNSSLGADIPSLARCGSSPFGERESPASWTGRGQSICQVRAFRLSTEVGIVLAMRKAYLSGACVSLKYRSCERSNSISDSELELLGESKFRLAPVLNILLAIVCKLNNTINVAKILNIT